MSDDHAKRFTHGDRAVIVAGSLFTLAGSLGILSLVLGALT